MYCDGFALLCLLLIEILHIKVMWLLGLSSFFIYINALTDDDDDDDDDDEDVDDDDNVASNLFSSWSPWLE